MLFLLFCCCCFCCCRCFCFCCRCCGCCCCWTGRFCYHFGIFILQWNTYIFTWINPNPTGRGGGGPSGRSNVFWMAINPHPPIQLVPFFLRDIYFFIFKQPYKNPYQSYSSMVFILYGNSEHVAHAWIIKISDLWLLTNVWKAFKRSCFYT